MPDKEFDIIRKNTLQDGKAQDKSLGDVTLGSAEIDFNLNSQTEPALLAHILRGFEEAENNKSDIINILDQSKLQRSSEYDLATKTRLKETYTTETYMPLTASKCNSAQSWILDMVITNNPKEHPFDISPTEKPELSNNDIEAVEAEAMRKLQEEMAAGAQPTEGDIQAFAEHLAIEYQATVDDTTEKATKKMKKRIIDQLQYGSFYDAFADFAYTFVGNPSAIMKMYIKREPRAVWNGSKYDVQLRSGWAFKNVNPYNIYFSPRMTDIDRGDLFERVQFTRKDLSYMREQKGYVKEGIDKVLDTNGRNGLIDFGVDKESVDIEGEGFETRPSDGSGGVLIDGVEFWGSVSGSMLKEWNVKGVKDLNKEYDITATVVDNQIIHVALNPHPLGQKPYAITSWEKNPESLWGKGIPQKIKNAQNDANLAYRELVTNLALASGPQMMRNLAHISPDQVDQPMLPRTIWDIKGGAESESIKASDVFDFFSVPSNSVELMNATMFFSNQADESAGIPKVAEGNVSNSRDNAASTASGLSMILDNASKNIRRVMLSVDRNIIRRLIKMLYMFNMMDEEVPDNEKADLEIVARGALSSAVEDRLNSLRYNFFITVLQNSEQLMGIIGRKRFVGLLREITKPLQFSENEIIPTDFELDQLEANEQQAVAQEATTQGMLMMLDQLAQTGEIPIEKAQELAQQLAPQQPVQQGA